MADSRCGCGGLSTHLPLFCDGGISHEGLQTWRGVVWERGLAILSAQRPGFEPIRVSSILPCFISWSFLFFILFLSFCFRRFFFLFLFFFSFLWYVFFSCVFFCPFFFFVTNSPGCWGRRCFRSEAEGAVEHARSSGMLVLVFLGYITLTFFVVPCYQVYVGP